MPKRFIKPLSGLEYVLDRKCPLHTNGVCGKLEAHINWSIVKPEKAASFTETTLRATGFVLADSRQ